MFLNDHSDNVPVTLIDVFLLKVEQDNTRKFMEIVYNINYKYFDDNDLWSFKMERKYMDILKFQYTEGKSLPHRTKQKGCFQILACGKITELVKRIQRTGKRSHGKYFTLKMKGEDDGKLQKQKIGIFHLDFIKKIKGDSKGTFLVGSIGSGT